MDKTKKATKKETIGEIDFKNYRIEFMGRNLNLHAAIHTAVGSQLINGKVTDREGKFVGNCTDIIISRPDGKVKGIVIEKSSFGGAGH